MARRHPCPGATPVQIVDEIEAWQREHGDKVIT
jgi:hypothetical protein